MVKRKLGFRLGQAQVGRELLIPGSGSPTSAWERAMLDSGPLAWWRLDESSGTVARDETGNGHDGTYSGEVALGQPSLLDGDYGRAASFDGENDLADVADDPALHWGTGSVTFACWISADTPISANTVIMGHGAAGASPGVLLGLDFSSDTKPQIGINDEAGTGFAGVVATTDVVASPSAHFVVGVLDRAAGRLRIYVDGAQEATGDVSGHGSVTSTLGLTLGTRPPTQRDYPYKGVLDEAAVWDRALSAQEIADLYDAGYKFSPFDIDWDAAYWASDPDVVAPSDGELVTSWPDGSGNGHTLGGGHIKPVFDRGGLNGQYAWVRNGATDGTLEAAVTRTRPCTTVMVFGLASAGTSTYLSTRDPTIYIAGGGGLNLFHGSGGGPSITPAAGLVGTPHVLVTVSKADNTADVWLDGVQEVAGAAIGTNVGDSIRVGYVNGFAADYQIGFLATMNGTVISTADRQAIEQWAADTYAVSL